MTKILYNQKWIFLGFVALTLKPFIFVKGDSIDLITLTHEKVHLKQQRTMGLINFIVWYLILTLAYGYHNNPLEKEARGE
jgi:hypothetical protein